MLDQLHLGYDRQAQRRTADASQLLDQCADVRLAHHCHRSRRPAAHAPDVPLQRVGNAVCRHWDGSQARRASQSGRRADPATGRSRRGDPDVRRTCSRLRDPRRGGAAPLARRTRAGEWDRTGRGRRRPSAEQHHRAGRDRSRMGIHPDLRPYRDRTTAHDQSCAGRMGPPRVRRARPTDLARRDAGDRGQHSHRRHRRSVRRGRTRSSPATGTSPRTQRRWSSTGGSIRGTVV